MTESKPHPPNTQESRVGSRSPASAAPHQIAIILVIIGFTLLPVFVLGAATISEDTMQFIFDGLGIPIGLIAAGNVVDLLARRRCRATRITKTYRVAAPPEEVVEKVILWGSGPPRMGMQAEGTKVIFTRRYRSAARATFLGAVWMAMFVSLSLIFLMGIGLILSCALFILLFFLVGATETLTVTATAIGGGSKVTIDGQAVPGLIERLERLMATSPALPVSSPA